MRRLIAWLVGKGWLIDGRTEAEKREQRDFAEEAERIRKHKIAMAEEQEEWDRETCLLQEAEFAAEIKRVRESIIREKQSPSYVAARDMKFGWEREEKMVREREIE